ncbi:MAG: tRNA uridine-5-carboxymethylaminomethyl(34) synthesis enzyme MnmG [Candidatus Omnitrophica bacterium]|nr:tRNA uridine-5-carboxymethylaminomethyl(34) synthesis enzyme MnmG [Candidatus Omnitrophota bacterium]
MLNMEKYDCIVIGAGHAGIEAANSAASLGCSVLLLTIDIDGIGKLSCNPAIGGVAKGHLVRELDALGGIMGRLADANALGYRILNRSKGKAVWATRAQVDMFRYPETARFLLENNPNIRILQAKVDTLLVKGNKVCGIRTNFGQDFFSKAVIICAGTFLKSKIHIGLNSFSGGRIYEESSDALFDSIKALGFKTKHFKTGTCARLDKRSIDFSKMVPQPPEKDVEPFSFTNEHIIPKYLSCFITYTNIKTHKVILSNLKYSPLYSGKIKSQGVRYCPSLEDKVVKFKDKDRHHVFVEPEGENSEEVYPNGISTSLPFDVQLKFIHTIKGMEKARILRPGYGIEHGLINSRQLYHTLEAKTMRGLYFAGQINGTTGYEEAAAQGLVAGINAALKVRKRKEFTIARNLAYIGVLIDDLVTKGTDEPYRMFTSRSEFRLSLRESNASMRLVPQALSLGILGKNDYSRILGRQKQIDSILKKSKAKKISLEGQRITLFDFLKRPKADFSGISGILSESVDIGVQREVEILAKYEGFLKRECAWVRELENLNKVKMTKIDYSKVSSLSKEIIEKLKKFQPVTLGEALQISGVTPAAILNILHFIKGKKSKKKSF